MVVPAVERGTCSRKSHDPGLPRCYCRQCTMSDTVSPSYYTPRCLDHRHCSCDLATARRSAGLRLLDKHCGICMDRQTDIKVTAAPSQVGVSGTSVSMAAWTGRNAGLIEGASPVASKR